MTVYEPPEPPDTRALTRVLDDEWSVERIVEQTLKIQQCMTAVMKRDEHYGVIPGTGKDGKPGKPTLLKPGAEKLCLMFRLCPEYETIRAEQSSALISYTIRCKLVHIPTGNLVATGLGSCNSREKKYTRPADRKCPSCGKETIIKGKEEYGGGWLCYAKKGGCGAKYKDGDATIEKQDTGLADPSDLDNTILKMACKRALVAAVLNGTAASDCFTQDLEDLTEKAAEYVPPAKEEAKAPAPKDDTHRTPGTSPTSHNTNGSGGTSGTTPRRSTAEVIKDYVPANQIQVRKGDTMAPVDLGKEILALVGETLDDTTFRTVWLKPYKTHDGQQVGSVSQLTEKQAMNIRNRLRAQKARNAIRHENAEADLAQDVDRLISSPPVKAAAQSAKESISLEDMMAQHMETPGDAAAWLHGLFGVTHVQELQDDDVPTAFALLAAFGTNAYDALEEKARAMGKIR